MLNKEICRNTNQAAAENKNIKYADINILNKTCIPSKEEVRKKAKLFRLSLNDPDKKAFDDNIFNNVLSLLNLLYSCDHSSEIPGEPALVHSDNKSLQKQSLTVFGSNIRTDRSFGSPAFSCLFTYVSFGKEPDTIRLIDTLLNTDCENASCYEKQLRFLAVPKVTSPGFMEFYYVKSLYELEPGSFGIYEPKHGCPPCNKAVFSQCPIIVPGLAFTKSGRRCGYGGGYYDRFLGSEPGHISIGLCYSGQLFDDFETGVSAVNVNYIVTENEIIHCG